MSRLLVMVILVSILTMLGCKSVKPSDLVGTWVVKDSSREALPIELQKHAGKVVLGDDGKFVAFELPKELPPTPPYDPKHRNFGVDTGSGVWNLISREGKQQVQLNFQRMEANRAVGLPYGTQLDVSRGWSALSLDYFLGDADEGRRISLEKK